VEAEGTEEEEARRGHGKGLRNGFIGALTDTKFDKDIFSLAIPALGSLILEPVVRTLEAVMVGRLGAAPLGALSIGGSVVSVSFPLFNFFSYATTPMVARALARNDPDEASRLVAQGIWLSTMVGTALGIFMFFCADGILTTMGANAEIFPLARVFLLIRSVSAPVWGLGCRVCGLGIRISSGATTNPLRVGAGKHSQSPVNGVFFCYFFFLGNILGH
jgi:Na+-driven multidrug efflux pump